MILIDAQRVTVSRPERPLFSELSLTVSSGDRIGVVGINGTGKSTLLRIIGGLAVPESGRVVAGSGVRFVMLDQAAELPPGTVREAVGDSWEAAAVLDRLGMGRFENVQVTRLSGGQRKRVALARSLVVL